MIKRIFKILLVIAVAVALFVVPPAIYYFMNYYRSLEQEVVARFSGKRWDIPSRIYSDSLIIYPGQGLDDLGFFQRLARLNYHRVDKVANRGEYSYDKEHGKIAIFLHSFAYPYREYPGEQLDVRLDSNGKVLLLGDSVTQKPVYSFELEPEMISGIFEGSWEQRRLVRLSQIPPVFIDAILAAEDHRFYEHHGLDPARIIKAGWIDLTARRVRQGGSTLTQQLMKNFFLSQDRNWRRKLKEAIMAYIAESRFSKDEILENYINDIYLGQRGQEGIYGVWEASQYYFSHEPRDLTIGEMATVAGMIQSPNRLNPSRHPDVAKVRRDEILGLMLGDGFISKAAYQQAIAEPVRARELFTEGNDAPFFVDYLKRELAERYPPGVLSADGYRIFTTLDVHMSKLAEKAIEKNLEDLETKHPRLKRKEADDRLEGALIAIEPQSGKIRVMVGGREYRTSQLNRVTQSKRQPGSVFKPVTYIAALEETQQGGPEQFMPTTYIEDAPFTWEYGDNMSWTPRNYKDRYFGHVMLKFALMESLNSATSRLANAIGLERVQEVAKQLGFGDLPPYPSIVLGGIEVSPIQVARAYSILANGGLEVPAFAVTEVTDKDGKVVEGHQLEAHRVLSPEVAYEIEWMLQQVINHGTGAGARRLGFTRPAAGKTGTTNDAKDAWFAGFTPNLLAVVWTGFDKKEELGLTGAQAALPIWTAFMKGATAPRPALDFPEPPDVVTVMVDAITGYKAGPFCPNVTQGIFQKGTEPTQVCPIHTAATGVTHVEQTTPAPDETADPND